MAVTNADILGWLNANPDASPELINQTMAEAGVSAAQYQSATGTPPPPVTQASSPEKFATLVQEATSPAVNTVAPTSTKVVGGPVQTNPAVSNADILGWFNANPNADTALINQTMQTAGVSPQQVSAALSSNPDVAKTYLTQQILGQGTANQWSGEGFGSAQANAADMAKILSSIGITDISQFGKVTKEVPTYDEFGTQIGTEKVETFGNKVTGQAVPNTYSERQTGNFFGGTFAGKGNTGYGVQFDASGKPVFYTQGASSSDIGNLMPLIQIGLMATGAGGLLGNALLGTGASQIASGALGNAILGGVTSGIAGGDVLKGALLGGAGGALGGYLQDGSAIPTLDSADTAGGLIPKYGTSYDDWMQLVMDNPEAQQAMLDLISNQAAQTGLTATPTTAETAVTPSIASSTDNVNITAKVPQQISPDILNAALLNNNYNVPNVNITSKGLMTQGNGSPTDILNLLATTPNIPTTTIIGEKPTSITDDSVKGIMPIIQPSLTLPTIPTGTTTDTSKDLTDSQKVNLIKAGLGLVGALGGGSAVGGLFGGGGTGGGGVFPTQGVPLNSQDYFNTIQQNYNRLLPAVPRDVATPLAQWYNSSYGA